MVFDFVEIVSAYTTMVASGAAFPWPRHTCPYGGCRERGTGWR